MELYEEKQDFGPRKETKLASRESANQSHPPPTHTMALIIYYFRA